LARLRKPVTYRKVAALITVVLAVFSSCRSTDVTVIRPFSVEVEEVRVEEEPGQGTARLAREEFRSQTRLHGRMQVAVTGVGEAPRQITVFNDSIIYRSRAPLRFDAYMSLDTLFSVSKEEASVTVFDSPETYDAMLVCLFEGKALRVDLNKDGGLRKTDHLKESCPGGIYRRLDLPTSLGMFILSEPLSKWNEGEQWSELKRIPAYSGVEVPEAIRVQCSVGKIAGEEAPLRLAADTTLTDFAPTMPNGEAIEVLNEHLEITGTLWIDTASGLARRGEIQISEDIRYQRPEYGPDVLRKTSKYVVKLEVGLAAR
jgi:hypothetical protein